MRDWLGSFVVQTVVKIAQEEEKGCFRFSLKGKCDEPLRGQLCRNSRKPLCSYFYFNSLNKDHTHPSTSQIYTCYILFTGEAPLI